MRIRSLYAHCTLETAPSVWESSTNRQRPSGPCHAGSAIAGGVHDTHPITLPIRFVGVRLGQKLDFHFLLEGKGEAVHPLIPTTGRIGSPIILMASVQEAQNDPGFLPSPPPTPPTPPTKLSERDLESRDQSCFRMEVPAENANILIHRKPADYDENHWATILQSNSSDSHDPLLLRDRLQDEVALSRLRKNGRKAKPVGNFYEVQNEHINNMLKSLDEDAEEAQQMNDSVATHVKIAIRASFIVNCLLAGLQLYAAISSLSLSFFATALDAVFDPCANFALNYAHRYATKVDLTKYPSGGSRFETIGNIIYSAAMGCASVVLVVESIESLAKGSPTDQTLHIPAIAAVTASFVAKAILFVYCWAIRNQDGQVRVLWEDHRNDLFINAFGIFTNAAGAKIKWWIDPLGAMLISIALIVLWGSSISREFKLLAGQSAPADFMQRVVYKAMTFSSHIEKIDSCKCYHVGPNYFVEIDIVVDGNTPLWLAHDLGQKLQDKLEALPNVDRAFVHLDHEVDHKPEHARHK